MPHNPSAEIDLLVSREQAENAFAAALRIFAGRGRRYSMEQLAKGIGLNKDGKPHTKPLYDFISYPSGHPDHRPLHMGIQFSIAKFLGAEFSSEWLRLCSQGAFDLTGDEPDPGSLIAETCEDASTIARAAMDGELDTSDRKHLRPVGHRLIARGHQLVSLGAVG